MTEGDALTGVRIYLAALSTFTLCLSYIISFSIIHYFPFCMSPYSLDYIIISRTRELGASGHLPVLPFGIVVGPSMPFGKAWLLITWSTLPSNSPSFTSAIN